MVCAMSVVGVVVSTTMTAYKTPDKERERLRIKSREIYYSRVDLGDQAKLWNELKANTNLKSHAAMADFLMTTYDKAVSSGTGSATAHYTTSQVAPSHVNRRCRKLPKKTDISANDHVEVTPLISWPEKQKEAASCSCRADGEAEGNGDGSTEDHRSQGCVQHGTQSKNVPAASRKRRGRVVRVGKRKKRCASQQSGVKKKANLDPQDRDSEDEELEEDVDRCELEDIKVEKSPVYSHHVIIALGTDGRLHCENCQLTFKRWSQAEEHTGSWFRYTCDGCGRLFGKGTRFGKHRSTHLTGDEISDGDANNRKICEVCSATFLYDKSLEAHMKMAHSVELKLPVKNQYACLLCGETVKGLWSLGIHVTTHYRKEPGIKCRWEGCRQLFPSEEEAKKHFQESHRSREKNERELCQQCGMFFHNRRQVKRHVEEFHVRLRKYPCDWAGCGKSFLEKRHLKNHLLIHADEKPLKCELCDYSCRQRTSMNWHLKKHGIFKKPEQQNGGPNSSLSTSPLTRFLPTRGRKSMKMRMQLGSEDIPTTSFPSSLDVEPQQGRAEAAPVGMAPPPEDQQLVQAGTGFSGSSAGPPPSGLLGLGHPGLPVWRGSSLSLPFRHSSLDSGFQPHLHISSNTHPDPGRGSTVEHPTQKAVSESQHTGYPTPAHQPLPLSHLSQAPGHFPTPVSMPPGLRHASPAYPMVQDDFVPAFLPHRVGYPSSLPDARLPAQARSSSSVPRLGSAMHMSSSTSLSSHALHLTLPQSTSSHGSSLQSYTARYREHSMDKTPAPCPQSTGPSILFGDRSSPGVPLLTPRSPVTKSLETVPTAAVWKEKEQDLHPAAEPTHHAVNTSNIREQSPTVSEDVGREEVSQVEEREGSDCDRASSDDGSSCAPCPASDHSHSDCGELEKGEEDSSHVIYAMTDGKARCETCDIVFPSWTDVSKHIGHRAAFRYTCDGCCQLFYSTWTFIRHRLSHNQGSQAVDDDDSGLLKCSRCPSRFLCERLLHSHLKDVHQKPVKPLAKRDFVCLVCRKAVSGIKSFGLHVSAHHQGEGVRCPWAGCDQVFPTRAEASRHGKAAHKKEVEAERSSVLCQLCGMMYSWRSIRSHVNSVHRKDRKHACQWPGCGKNFLERKHLKKHMMIHTDEKPLKCKFCDYSCRQRNSMNWHLKKHGIIKTPTPPDPQDQKSSGLTPRRGRKGMRGKK